jgi:ankyrin repeat protein
MENLHDVFEQLMTNEEDECLVAVAAKGDKEEFLRALNSGADINLQNHRGWNALRAAIHHNHYEIIRICLERKADLEAKNATGWTALMVAAANDKPEAVRMLIRPGADVNAKNANYATPLMFAAQAGHVCIARELIEQGARLDCQTREGLTALMLAVENGHVAMVRLLLEKGADPAIVDDRGLFTGDTALSIAQKHGFGEISALLEHPATAMA